MWWDSSGLRVRLFIRGAGWVAFDEGRTPHGGNYRPGATPNLPEKVVGRFNFVAQAGLA